MGKTNNIPISLIFTLCTCVYLRYVLYLKMMNTLNIISAKHQHVSIVIVNMLHKELCG